MNKEEIPPSDFVVADQRGSDRRNHGDRRKRQLNVAVERRGSAERRHGADRRLDTDVRPPDDPEDIVFMKAMDQYKWANRRPFPTWSEVLEVLHSLGYRKSGVAPPPPPAEAPDPEDVEPPIDVEERNERRNQGDRRKRQIPVAFERRSGTDRRIERRRQVDPTTCEKEYSDEEIVFMRAMDNYKRVNRRPFPTWSEVLEVLRSLGYEKTAEATELPGNKLTALPTEEE